MRRQQHRQQHRRLTTFTATVLSLSSCYRENNQEGASCYNFHENSKRGSEEPYLGTTQDSERSAVLTAYIQIDLCPALPASFVATEVADFLFY